MKIKYFALFPCFFFVFATLAAQNEIKVGIIGLDTSHSSAFIKLLNSETPQPGHEGFKVVAAYPYGSQTIESSAKRIPEYTEEAKKYKVKIVGSIRELLDEVDCILLETNDGNLHLEQAEEVMKSGKPMFIDKPLAANLPEAIAIFLLAKKYDALIFSSSALRFTPRNQELRRGEHGRIVGADCYSPATGEPSHTDFSWYGIHGVETLFTVMGPGCREVTRVSTEGTDVVTGLWEDGRIGTFRGCREGKTDYGGTVFCESLIIPAGGYEGYVALLTEILLFFQTKTVPVSEAETLDIFTFMEASNESKRQNGKPVSMGETFEKGLKEAEKILEKRKM
ncbi:MAG: Gfo/Idh/MocA family oxidoreductase [Prolixibacteraceae bacterium]|nr:Gfo/Idh/MocA family oxidoreductase [Prolixibacteraceae bacterium]